MSEGIEICSIDNSSMITFSPENDHELAPMRVICPLHLAPMGMNMTVKTDHITLFNRILRNNFGIRITFK